MAVLVGIFLMLAVAVLGGATAKDGTFFGPTVAAWVQALGSIGAIAGAAWIAGREERRRNELFERDVRTAREAVVRDLYIVVAAARSTLSLLERDDVPPQRFLVLMPVMQQAIKILERTPILAVKSDEMVMAHHTAVVAMEQVYSFTLGCAEGPMTTYERTGAAKEIERRCKKLTEAAHRAFDCKATGFSSRGAADFQFEF